MSVHQGRYAAASGPVLAEGWTFHRLTRPSRLFGANGIRTGADGRIYVAQVTGSQISAIDVGTGAIETICAMGGDIVAPDDLVFDDAGNLYATEFTEGRVSQRAPDGTTRVVQADMPCANPIAFHAGRLYAGECRPGGRILELSLDGGAPRVIVDDVLMPNAMEVGPDGKLYYPVMGTNEIWRVDLAGGTPEKVAGDLGVPDAVKFDADGFIVSTQVASGQVLRIDPRTGDRTVLATVAPGLDNLTFLDRRLFVSSISGQVNEILGDGSVRPLIPDGLNWPLGLALNPDGLLYVADGPYAYTWKPGAERQLAGMMFTPGFPGHARGIAAHGEGTVVVTTANGAVSRWTPSQQAHQVLAEGFDRLYGVAVASDGTVVFAEGGTGRVLSVRDGRVETLADGLLEPRGVAIAPDGCLVAESGAGRVVQLAAGRVETILDGLQQPQGLVVRDGVLYVVDAGAKEVIAYHLARKTRRTIAGGLPVGAPPGVTPKFLRAIPPLSGPMGPFTGIAAGADGTLYVSGDADGSLLALRPN
ncbi:MAG TPA: SMP-30/gluconolactonase/LRE family protein [Nevskiaceae bacterium]|nr:SMP-30/gluconolactonase/LRE family protein [Nevskiaceae bacterium]